MSQDDKVNDLKIEIQKLLGEINRDMSKLKTEVTSLHHILEGDASLPMNVKLVNERLTIAAKEAGINLDDLETEAGDSEECSEQNLSEHNASEPDKSESGDSTQESPEDNNEQTASTSNAASLAVATDKLTKAIKRTLR